MIEWRNILNKSEDMQYTARRIDYLYDQFENYDASEVYKMISSSINNASQGGKDGI